jgi:rhamnosyltransferase
MPVADVWAIVILYRPQAEAVRRQHEALRAQVAGIVYYDNGDGRATLDRLDLTASDAVRCLGDGQNVGIAEGLNRGLALVRELGAARALLLDQDSVPAADMVAALAETQDRAGAQGARVGAVGPAIFDELTGAPEPFGHAVTRAARRPPPNAAVRAAPVELFYLITSGTLVSLAVIDAVGAMESSLFIDAVDFEWSYRARARGYRFYGSWGARLHHNRGEGMHRVPVLGLKIRLHSATRHFYIFRNHLRLCFRPYLPTAWKLRGLWYLVQRTVLFGLFVPGRLAHLRAMSRGTWQGLREGLADRRRARAAPSLGPG